jgi:hypothetical protein
MELVPSLCHVRLERNKDLSKVTITFPLIGSLLFVLLRNSCMEEKSMKVTIAIAVLRKRKHFEIVVNLRIVTSLQA